MSQVSDILEKMHNGLYPYSGAQVAKAFMDKLGQLDLDGSPVSVESVDVRIDGNVNVIFADEEGDSVEIAFGVDEDEGAYALVVSDGDDAIILDLDTLDPPLVAGMFEIFVELTNLDWMTSSTLFSLLAAGDVGEDDDDEFYDDNGNERISFATSYTPEEALFIKTDKGYVLDIDKINESKHLRRTGKKKIVIRGGKRIKLPVMRKVKKMRLNPKQKMGLKKAQRASRKPGAKRKRARSLKIRKRMGIKPTKMRRGEKTTR